LESLKKFNKISEKMDFRDAKANFFNAARYGMATQFVWENKLIPSHQLILDELLPMAYKGLYSAGVSPKDAEYYLKIIENRINSHTGSEWMVKSYRNLLKSKRSFEALQIIALNMYIKQQKNYPVSSWSLLNTTSPTLFKDKRKVYHRMNKDIFSVGEKDSIELVLHIMQWKKIHHMPVINDKKELIGLLSWTDVKNYLSNNEKLQQAVGSIMIKELITITQFESLEHARNLMTENKINSLPVIQDKRLIGIITSLDF
jgi:CBS domain-containing protein